jgi:hypothetical protein
MTSSRIGRRVQLTVLRGSDVVDLAVEPVELPDDR